MVYKYIDIEDFDIDFILLIRQLKIGLETKGYKSPTQGKAFALIEKNSIDSFGR
jgi:hypothetical protein